MSSDGKNKRDRKNRLDGENKRSRSKDEETKSEEKRRKKKELDPDGSLKVARGLTKEEAEQQHKDLLEKIQTRDRDAIDEQLWGTSKEVAKERREALKLDDANPNLSKLNTKQKLALKGRDKKRISSKIARHEAKRMQAAVAAVDAQEILQTDRAGFLEPENEMERTNRLTQLALKRHLKEDDPESARQIFDLQLPQSAPYGMEYDRSGRYSILYGQTLGHLAMMDCHQQSLVTEFHVRERVRDACFLHNFTLFAAAQKDHVYIYDQNGAEVHRLSDHSHPLAMQFLPYHWLLATIGKGGLLRYQDTSTGESVATHRTKLGACSVLRQNPSNAVLHAGHSNGCVTLWSPSSSVFLAKILCHKGAAIHSLAIDRSGRTMVTGGADNDVRIWDLRMYRELHNYFTFGGPPTSLDISQRGVLGVGHGSHATFWGPEALSIKIKHPYMRHRMNGCGPVETLRFRPFEDVCGLAHAKGISSIVIPGSGEPSVDTAEFNTNPLQDVRQRKQEEVRALLDKLRPEMISLDPNQIGGIEESDPHKRRERIKDLAEQANEKFVPPKKQKSNKRGRSKIQVQLRRKERSVVEKNTAKYKEMLEQDKLDKKQATDDVPMETPKDSAPAALKRFF